jgi:hypothetical protein
MAQTTPGPTPSGGAYGIVYFLDSDGAETTRADAEQVELREYSDLDELLAVTTSYLTPGRADVRGDQRTRERERLEELLEIYRIAIDELKHMEDPSVAPLMRDLVGKLVESESDLARIEGRLSNLAKL